ncbi:hydantoinase/oxoprolinase family protein [Pseudonocardia sp. KRD-184]|uniref:Hydantoinase/oxoprolinase family protein n=2 Tax=Pseudonocardia oceani TaxID=2792013 RepID=A0ABS6U491_9PSEU|nr:hydantoinase/oxoprolinase family protein [Pseudonocardia oceani]MBW0097442.1 hydantoinase/oxoprolinase family protein [Pseudonocardia oceani]MBW0123778.1 hydantoinase/oxoprolinase family protein [Pseudonocardia oceani]MBW0127057.1 hydantoinase/oxoprolinase family protein [Pseudonocardia oceani]
MIGIDVGGTFTDVIAVREGRIETRKVPATREAYLSVLEGAERADASRSSVLNHASTHGLNAIITRRLPKIAFLTTTGHRDLLDYARIWRPAEAAMDPSWRRSFSDVARPLVPRYLRRGVVERTQADGQLLVPLDEDQLRAELEVLRRCEVEGVAICFLNAFVNPTNEQVAQRIVREVLGDVACSISSETSPLARVYGRASTTVVDVIMKISYVAYNDHLTTGLEKIGFTGQLNYADSAATLVSADAAMRRPHRIVFSGPAAGTAACKHFGASIGDGELICVDVGGTSTDLSVVTGGAPYLNTTYELEHDLTVNSLSTSISTLGAGGGSIAWINDLGELRVGPDSAGGVPGPCCYGAGGTRPTITDACLLSGVLEADKFLGGEVPLHPDLAEAGFLSLETDGDLSRRVRDTWQLGVHNIAEGIVNLALAHGVNPVDYSLVAYGAAGPMLLPSVLDHLTVRRVVIPPHPGLFSALGLLTSDQVYSESRSAYTVLGADAVERVAELLAETEATLREQLVGVDPSAVTVTRSFDGRLYGQSWDTPFVEIPDGPVTEETVQTMIDRFHDTYERRNGTRFTTFPVEAVTFRVQAVVRTDKLTFEPLATRAATGGAPATSTTTVRHIYGDDVTATVVERPDLLSGDEIAGPAIVREAMSTTVVPPGRTVRVGRFGELVIS